LNERQEEQNIAPPAVTLPKGGGALRGIGEKFTANPVNGTGSITVPVFTSPGRSQFYPHLVLTYDSGAGNSPFGLGWNISVPCISRKTDKRLPKYQDLENSDVFLLSSAEDLVPVLVQNGENEWTRKPFDSVDGLYTIERYRPRVEGLFARIEKWQDKQTGQIHWRSISKDNVTSIYGKSTESRIADPKDETKVFKWLLEESFDDKGNVILYKYENENDQNVDRSLPNEKNRLKGQSFANAYPKRILYGNEKPFERNGWLFEVVFDYGEHDLTKPDPEEIHAWPVRPDAFSQYRAGFEIRTYRLCRRVLMFHHFPELGNSPYLVRSTDFQYNETDAEQSAVACYLISVTQTGYVKDAQSDNYKKRSFPSVEFDYSRRTLNEEICVPDNVSLQNLPAGLNHPQSQWVDLNGGGVSGILTEEGHAWFYKQNLSDIPIPVTQSPFPPVFQSSLENVQFAASQLVSSKPAALLEQGKHQFLDLAGDGEVDLVSYGQPLAGFYEREQNGEWHSFTPFESTPQIDWKDPNLRWIDLTGDGHPDILISKDDVFLWYPSTAEQGFGTPETILKLQDEEEGPTLVFSDPTQSIYLADMSGSGMTEIVRIRNNEVCYWPNLGYGRFGAKVTMANAPQFDYPDQFEPNRIKLADIDGSGTTDILYFAGNSATIWFNQAGNSWSEPHPLSNFPHVDNLSQISVFDLLANGTACIVWSSPLPDANGSPLRYMNLMGGVKPHLLNSVTNNMGSETRVRYAPSTKFFLEDYVAGKPWITKLPFPVQVIERTETYDSISKRKSVTLYKYHHGYFDAQEREFRGFGFVEQWDTEFFGEFVSGSLFPEEPGNANAAFHLPPIYTKSWFHTGFFLNREVISHHFTGEYYRQPQISDEDFENTLLPDTVLPPGLSIEEDFEACRALKGNLLRQEIYSVSSLGETGNPYAISEYAYNIRMIQPRSEDRRGVFYAYTCETLNSNLEKSPQDPRITQSLILHIDDFGNPTKTVSVYYPRLNPLFPEQEKTFLIYSEMSVANKTEEPDWYRTGMFIESKTYELTGFTPASGNRFAASDFLLTDDELNFQKELSYHELPTSGRERRLTQHTRMLYYKEDLTGASPLGEVNQRGLIYQNYKLAFAGDMVLHLYGNHITETILKEEGKFIKSADYKLVGLFPDEDDEENWWSATGRHIPDPARFYLTSRFVNPFIEHLNLAYEVTYDDHSLLMTQVKDPLGNLITIGTRDDDGNVLTNANDYRLLMPSLVTDPNGNRSAVAFDGLGRVAGTAVVSREGLGDSLDGFEPDLDDSIVAEHLTNPLINPEEILGNATARFLYDFYRDGRPNVVYSMARETHQSDLNSQEKTNIQHVFAYSDGMGQSLQSKIQAEPGEVDGVSVENRWVGSGTTIFNNKGKAIRKYEPFFDDTHFFHQKETGVSLTLFYDPLERPVATLHPNHTYEKVVFDSWRAQRWDLNDNIHPLQRYHPQTPDVLPNHAFNPIDDPNAGEFFRQLPESDFLPTWYDTRMDPIKALSQWPGNDAESATIRASEKKAAQKAAKHASTPEVSHLDSLGRTFLTVTDNGDTADGTPREQQTHIELDIQSNLLLITDALQRKALISRFDMLGTAAHTTSIDAGELWTFKDCAGKIMRTWNSRGIEVRRTYDSLQRNEDVFTRQQNESEILIEHTIYGETHPQAVQLNLRGKAYQLFDSAGVITNEEYDFKGNLLQSSRQFLQNYKDLPDWSVNQELETEIYRTSTTYNAFNRTVTVTTPDQSVSRVQYNVRSNLIERLDVQLHAEEENGQPKFTPFITNMDYDAKGQRQSIEYGNGVRTRFEHDPLTFRTTNVSTSRTNFPADQQTVRDLSYFYDPVGNVSEIRDQAQQSIYFANAQIEPHAEYEYDALYQLIAAEGREHIGQITEPETTWDDQFRMNLPHPNDGLAMRRYVEKFEYDAVGNILNFVHHLGALQSPGQKIWSREFTYQNNNRLNSTILQRNSNQPIVESYAHDDSGNLSQMPHLSHLSWDYADRLQATAKQVVNNGGTPETTYYVYDATGQRVRKVTEGQAGAGETPNRKKERIYLGTFEIYREYSANEISLERETLQVMDDHSQVAIIETRTKGIDDSPPQVIRFQFSNHLGSASLELDEKAQIITYEEYYPYGGTSFQSGRSLIEVNLKRYRYSGKERDEETGFYYYGARYYASWLGRWTAVDPLGLTQGINLYRFCKNNPVRLVDADGRQAKEDRQAKFIEGLDRRFRVSIIDRMNELKKHPEFKKLDQKHQEMLDEIILEAIKQPDKIEYYAEKLELLFSKPFDKSKGTDLYGKFNDSYKDAKDRLDTDEGKKTRFDEENKTKRSKMEKVKDSDNEKFYYVDRSDPANIHVHVKVHVFTYQYYDFSKGYWVPKMNVADAQKVKMLEDDIEKQAAATAGYTIDLEFVNYGGDDVYEIGVNPDLWAQAHNWISSMLGLTHELHHLLGLPDRYDMIEEHADNPKLTVADRLEAFLWQMKEAPLPNMGRAGLMSNDPKADPRLLDAEVCQIAFPQEAAMQQLCIDARGINP
jgi:RHS repeat-associated protein